jgi:hypothetical protein
MSRVIDVEVKIHHETDKAYLVSTTTVEKVWLPKKINGEEYPVDERLRGFAVITVPEWWATEKELI